MNSNHSSLYTRLNKIQHAFKERIRKRKLSTEVKWYEFTVSIKNIFARALHNLRNSNQIVISPDRELISLQKGAYTTGDIIKTVPGTS